jgi:hypothetical protein
MTVFSHLFFRISLVKMEITIMSDEISELKAEERLKIEIPEEDVAAKPESTTVNVTEEFQKLGRQFANTLESAWNSEERQQVEGEVRAGLRSFVDEVDKIISDVKSNPTTEKVTGSAVDAKDRVGSSDVGQKAMAGIAGGLRWLGQELGTIADHFSVSEKSPEEVIPVDDVPVDDVVEYNTGVWRKLTFSRSFRGGLRIAPTHFRIPFSHPRDQKSPTFSKSRAFSFLQNGVVKSGG